jgi:hypothetical protein
MKSIKPKSVKKAVTKKVQKAKPVAPKLSKQDPEYYSKIGAISAARRKLNREFFITMAKLSHAPGARPDGYKGGRKPKVEPDNG